ncbi:hypothetical protein L2E82_51622 [Cichorium intybus]|nr:hypothetical protein L2E82_51622 [Cichorium intybus]
MSTIFQSIARSVGTEIISEEILASCAGGPRGNEQYASVFAALVAGLACLVGIDFGAKLLISLAKCFESAQASVYTDVDFPKRLYGFTVIWNGKSMENASRACCKGIKIGKILIHREGDNGHQGVGSTNPIDTTLIPNWDSISEAGDR